MDKTQIVEMLRDRGVDFEIYEHEPITSVEESKQLGLPHKEAGTKNFFLRDKKKRNYFIITTKEDKPVDLKQVREILGTTALSFASEEDLDRMLGIITGAVGPFAAFNDEEHKKLTGHSNRNILAFARFLRDSNVPVWIRHVLVPGLNDTREYLHALGYFLGELTNLNALDVLPYHTMGKVKYAKLGLEYPLGDNPPASKEDAARARDIIMEGIKDRLKDRRKEQ